MIYSVVFNISRGFCFYLAVNKESERTDLRTLAAFFSPLMRLRAVPCLYAGLWSSEGTYCTRPGLLEMLSLLFLPIGRGPARTHASQWPRRSASVQGRPTTLTSPRRPFSRCHTIQWIETGLPKHFHKRKHTLTRAHTLGFYRRDPQRSTIMGCDYLEASH